MRSGARLMTKSFLCNLRSGPFLKPNAPSVRSYVPSAGIRCLRARIPRESARTAGHRCSRSGCKKPKNQTKGASSAPELEPILFYSKWPGTPGQGKTIDFSPKGMRFICNEKLKPQTILKISSKLFEASGVVTNLSEEISNGRRYYVVGIYFQAVHFAESRGTFLSTSG